MGGLGAQAERFEELSSIEQDGEDHYVATPPGSGFLFGGLVLGVGLRAAAASVNPGFTSHSLRAYFLRSGEWGRPLHIGVERIRDGRSYAARRMTISQGGTLLAALAASFHAGEDGDDWHREPAPAAVGPASAPAIRPLLGGLAPIEVRPVDPGHALGHLSPGSAAIHPYWSRISQPLPDDPQLHLSALAFISDYLVVWAAGRPGSPLPAGRRTVTLDHSIWFHRPADANQWLLFSAAPISIGSGRATVRGEVHTAEGLLVASFVQEDSVRPASVRAGSARPGSVRAGSTGEVRPGTGSARAGSAGPSRRP